MELLTILQKSMALIGLPEDEETLELWRPRLLHWCNEGLMDLSLSLRPWYKETVQVYAGGKVYTDALAYRCVKVLGIEREGRRLTFYYDLSPQELLVPEAKEGEMVDLVYRYMPQDLEEDEDVPELPESCHGMLVSYIVAREKSQLDAGAHNVGRYSMALYEKQKQGWLKNQPSPWENQFYNMY